MKGLFLVLLVTLSGIAYGQDCKLTVHIEFANIEEGYDHVTKDELFIDGNSVNVTEERKESKAIDVKLKVPRGKHTFRIENWVLYEGTWEKKTLDNNYSIDGFGEIECYLGKKGKITVIYDLSGETTEPKISFK